MDGRGATFTSAATPRWCPTHRNRAIISARPTGSIIPSATKTARAPATAISISITQNVWRYFSDCLLYWLDKTGCPSNTPPNQTANRGIDGLRADFGQGLPPQCWEYIINKVRSRKWDFVFMTESLDGGAVTYRSNRHFDVLNENLIFDLQSAATASDYRNDFRRPPHGYGQVGVLLNNVSHDEQSYADPYEALIRYMACSTIDGAPMIFYGEELGISTYFGFDRYQLNFGKTIPQFMDYNSLQPICNPANRNFGLDQLWPVYAAINQARQFSAGAEEFQPLLPQPDRQRNAPAKHFLRGEISDGQRLAEFFRRRVRLHHARPEQPANRQL